MPLGTSKSTLEQDIVNAYKAVKDAGKEDGAEPSIIITTLADKLTTAINGYFSQAKVDTQVEVDAGQADTAGGATADPGSGTGTATSLS